MKINFFVVFFLLGTAGLLGQSKDPVNVSFDAFMTETQYISDSMDSAELVWWLPIEYWVISQAQDPTIGEAEVEAIRELLEPYELFVVVKGEVGYFGGITYESREDIVSQLTVSFDGNVLPIVEEKSIAADLVAFLSAMKPMMSSLLGPMGSNMHFILCDSMGKGIDINPTQTGLLFIQIGELKKEVQLPLGSLLMEKKCPIDGKLHSGKWNFCPMHGKELVQQ